MCGDRNLIGGIATRKAAERRGGVGKDRCAARGNEINGGIAACVAIEILSVV